ncbi:50S ribosomal protein L21 [Aureimonas populi]|uniref:Large ribosomal subunit protein bL21 n=1 Tax=Aureimonas populi TaxID=1701758 RepID=A0ABW5CN59_9HYPH|nr:50S ribosomal protein L21 [Aureimonas populi]
MFAVIKTGGKQYRVAANDEFTIERVAGEAGDEISFAEVLMVGTSIGAPFVSGASVVAEIVEQVRGPKVISFKKRRRQNSKRTRGHRQDLTLVRISEILTEGASPSKKEKKAAPASAEAPAVSEDAEAAPKAEKPKRATRKAETGEAKDEAPKKPRASKKKAEGADEA